MCMTNVDFALSISPNVQLKDAVMSVNPLRASRTKSALVSFTLLNEP